MRSTQILVSLLAILSLSACATRPAILGESYSPPYPSAPVMAPPSSGSIYSANSDVRLFEDQKAGRVGDIVTVRLVEQTNASKNSATSTSKSTAATLANPTAFGQALTKDGQALFEASLGGDSSFDGGGSSSQSNSLTGDITVTVVDRLPNGNLRIRGEKWLTLNQGREFIRLTGIVRAVDINPDNTLFSNRIADAQISYSSKGVLADANRMGLLSRFFNSILHPY